MHEKIAAENFARWDEALKTGDPANVAALYAQNLTLLPTLVKQTIAGREGALKYFTFFGSFHPTVEMVEEHVVSISPDSYLHCGIYSFTLDTPEGSRQPLDSRFSFVWKKRGEIWEVLHHHSSRVPVVSLEK